jgi:hypothetical protein
VTTGLVLVVDVANVMGSRADGWWRDRPGAARRLVDQVRSGLPDEHEVVLVVEGRARSGVTESDDRRVCVVHASADGDDAVVARARGLEAQGRQVVVVTADRELRDRVAELGVECRGPRWFLDLMT